MVGNTVNVYSCLFVFLSHLLDLFSEIEKWDQLKYEIPQCAKDIYQHKQDIRGLREGTLLLIRNYNRFHIHTCTFIVCQLVTPVLSLFESLIFIIVE